MAAGVLRQCLTSPRRLPRGPAHSLGHLVFSMVAYEFVVFSDDFSPLLAAAPARNHSRR